MRAHNDRMLFIFFFYTLRRKMLDRLVDHHLLAVRRESEHDLDQMAYGGDEVEWFQTVGDDDRRVRMPLAEPPVLASAMVDRVLRLAEDRLVIEM